MWPKKLAGSQDKSEGYGLINKGFGRPVNDLPLEQMTLTLVRHAFPRAMVDALRQSGFAVSNPYPGIYRIDGKISIPAQLVVSSQPPPKEYEGLRLLAKGATKREVVEYVERAAASGDDNIKTNAATVVGVCLSVNRDLGERLEEG